jgi:transcription elongation factor Elf1
MPDVMDDSQEIKASDVIFDCPHCGKSLAIDYRGAGLSIPCTDCGRIVDVPIPEGMEITDIDSSDEDKEMRMLSLRKSLAAAESRIVNLELRLDSVYSEKAALSNGDERYKDQLSVILKAVERMRRSLHQVDNSLAEIASVVERD